MGTENRRGQRDARDLLVGDLDAGIDERLHLRELARAPQGVGPLLDGPPEEHAEEEHGRHRQALGDPLVGAGEGPLDEAVAAPAGVAPGHVGCEPVRGGREQVLEQPVLPQPPVALQRVARLEDLEELVEQPGGRHAVDQPAEPRHGLRGLGVDLQVQLRGEAHRADHPHRVLPVAGLGVADQADRAGLDVAHAVHEVPDREISDVVVEGVDGEVAAPGVLLDGAEGVVLDDAAGRVQDLPVLALQVLVAQAAEGRHLDDLVPEPDVHQAEPAADEPRIAEQRPDLLGTGVRGDVEVLGLAVQQQIPHPAAHDEGLIPAILEAVEDLQGIPGNVRAGDVVVGSRDDAGRIRSRLRMGRNGVGQNSSGLSQRQGRL